MRVGEDMGLRTRNVNGLKSLIISHTDFLQGIIELGFWRLMSVLSAQLEVRLFSRICLVIAQSRGCYTSDSLRECEYPIF